MKKILAIIALICGSTAIGAPFEFSGYISTGDKAKMMIMDLADQKSSRWLSIGDSFRGYTLITYDASQEILTLKRESEVLQLRLKDAKIAAAKTKTEPEASGAKKQEPHRSTRAGDTALTIAQEHGLSVAELKKLNPDVNWARLRVGQKIRTSAEK